MQGRAKRTFRAWKGLMLQENLTQGRAQVAGAQEGAAGAQGAGAASQEGAAGAQGAGAASQVGAAGAQGAGAASQVGAAGAQGATQAGAQGAMLQQGLRAARRALMLAAAQLTSATAQDAAAFSVASGRMQGTVIVLQAAGAQTGAQAGAQAAGVASQEGVTGVQGATQSPAKALEAATKRAATERRRLR